MVVKRKPSESSTQVKTKEKSQVLTAPARKKMGRPKGSKSSWQKGTQKYNPGVCDRVINLMKKGYSQEVISAQLGITYSKFRSWYQTHKDFREAIEEGKRWSQLWWENQGILAVQGKIKGFNSAVWIFNMKNRFGWRDKQEITGDEDRPISVRVVKFSEMQDEKLIEPEWRKLEDKTEETIQ